MGLYPDIGETDFSTVIMNTPMMVPKMEPTPPEREVPPITTPAMDIQLKAVSGIGLCCGEYRHISNSCQSSKEAGENISQGFIFLYIDTGKSGSFLVGADG